MSLARAGSDSGTFGTEFVFAIPPACKPNWICSPVLDLLAKNYTNATIFDGFGDENNVGGFVATGVVLNSALVPVTAEVGIFDIGVRVKMSDLSAVQANLQIVLSSDQTDRRGTLFYPTDGMCASSNYIDSEGTLVYLTDTLGTDYITNGANVQSCSVVATHNSTKVTLLVPNTTSKTFELNDLQVLIFSVDDSIFGTRVKADLPIAVFLGSDCSNETSSSHCPFL